MEGPTQGEEEARAASWPLVSGCHVVSGRTKTPGTSALLGGTHCQGHPQQTHACVSVARIMTHGHPRLRRRLGKQALSWDHSCKEEKKEPPSHPLLLRPYSHLSVSDSCGGFWPQTGDATRKESLTGAEVAETKRRHVVVSAHCMLRERARGELTVCK